MSILRITSAIIMAGLLLISCNKDDVIEGDDPLRPQIILDSETGVYEVKAGESLTIAPTYRNVSGATYRWSVDGVDTATTPEFTKVWPEKGEYYVTLTVSNKAGKAVEEMRVDVLSISAPVISLPLKNNNLTIAVGTEYLLHPEINGSSMPGFKIEWLLDGEKVGSEIDYLFRATTTGEHTLTVRASNIDGSDERSITVKVVDKLPYKLSFPTPSYFQSSTTRYTFAGRPVYLTPLMENLNGGKFIWSVNGKNMDCNSKTLCFTPDTPGEYTVNLTVDDEATTSLKVVCVDATESQRYRKASPGSSSRSTKVFEWVPAPGQFIGDKAAGGMSGAEMTPDLANSWAEKQLEGNSFVSLGGFGGYIIVGFDHSIAKGSGEYDFAISGNAFLDSGTSEGGSNEPGIVYVMQDVNGNGLPDDEWYELRGCETGSPSTRQDYAVTYYRPAGPKMNVQWTDNYGSSGTIDYIGAIHDQDYYYPAWIVAETYTLRGTCLQSKTTLNPVTGNWDNGAFAWGYADNKGSDDLAGGFGTEGEGQRNGFKIENAMFADLSRIDLQYIDFIKVRTGVCAKSGRLGEVSTEVFNFQDLSIPK